MAFSNDIDLTGPGGEVRFTLLGNTIGQSERIWNGATLSEPLTLSIRHQTVQRNGIKADRHLTQFKICKMNSAGITRQAVVNFTIDRERDVVITDADVKSMVGYLVDFLRDGAAPAYTETVNVSKLMRGEV